MAIFNHIGKVRRCMGERIPRVAWRTPDRTDSRGRRCRRTVEDACPYKKGTDAGSYNKKTCKEVLEGLETSFKKFPRFIN